MTRAHFVAPLAGLALLASGCGNQQPGVTSDPADELRGRTFLSVQAAGTDVPAGLQDSHQIRLSFGKNGALSVQGGCNTTRGKANLDQGKLAVKDTSSTSMSCADRLHKQDAWLSQLLSDRPSWKMDNNRLKLTSDATKLVFADEDEAVPDRSLQKTRWEVESVTKDGAVAAPHNADRAYLQITDGEYRGSTGCNGMGGEVELGKKTLKFSGPIMTRMACDDGPGLESDLATVLDGKVTYTIEGDTLKLTQSSGTSLHLRAASQGDEGARSEPGTGASPTSAKDR